MLNQKQVFVFEYGVLEVGKTYNGNEFEQSQFDTLAKYLTVNPKCQFYSLYHKRVKFSSYVGVIQIGNITIEVLPKTDKHDQDVSLWQSILVKMLVISLDVESKTTNNAHINIKKHSVLETYMQLFLNEVQNILHDGLVKKYRFEEGNRPALKGKLLIAQHAVKNIVHAERFYVSHSIYDRNNIYNGILKEALDCISSINVSENINSQCNSILSQFPECARLQITERIFKKLSYDRKTDRYRKAIDLAKIILLNYHPDIKGGRNNVLAIMFDMNQLWENYVYWILRRSSRTLGDTISVEKQKRTLFWKHPSLFNIGLIPDIILKIEGQTIVLDTKWKYKADTSIEDIRQMYAYGHYFDSSRRYLIYPDNLIERKVLIDKGRFYTPLTNQLSEKEECGLMFVDLIDGLNLNTLIGSEILSALRN